MTKQEANALIQSEAEAREFSQENVLRMLHDLRASNSVFGWFKHKTNMRQVINNTISQVESGVCWRQ